jgi:hypothetical protein
MNTFEFVNNGVTYLVRGPTGSTVDQARQIFQQQLSSGSLVTIESGKPLNSINQASQGLVSAIAQVSQTNIDAASKNLFIQTDLSNVSLENAIDTVEFIQQGATNLKIGSLDNSTVQGLISQTSKTVGQSLTQITNQSGVGKFGFNAEQLEKQGFLKPNVAATISRTGGNLVANLSSPTVWTGKDGIGNVGDLLTNNKIQNSIQEGLMTSAYKSLQSVGAVQQLSSLKDTAAALNTAAKFGNNQAIALINGKLSGAAAPIVAGFAKASEFSATFGKIAGNLNNPSAVISGLTGNLTKLPGTLTTNLTGQLSGLAGGVTGQLSGLAGGVTGQLSGLAGGLSGQLSGALGGLTGQLSGALGGLTGQLSGALGGLTGQLSGALGGALGSLGGLGALGSFGGLGGGNPLQSGIKKAKAVFNTIDRKTVDASVQSILGNNKISLPKYLN